MWTQAVLGDACCAQGLDCTPAIGSLASRTLLNGFTDSNAMVRFAFQMDGMGSEVRRGLRGTVWKQKDWLENTCQSPGEK